MVSRFPMTDRPGVTVHRTADVDDSATIGPGTKVWHQAQVRAGAVIGAGCTLGKGSYVDTGVHIGSRCKLQNGVFVYRGFTIEDGVFLGPGVMLLNDKSPRAITPDGRLKAETDWTVTEGRVAYGASLGGGVVALPGVRIGRFALVGSGAIVTKDVPDHGIVIGNPARLCGFACSCGRRLAITDEDLAFVHLHCSSCGQATRVDRSVYGEMST